MSDRLPFRRRSGGGRHVATRSPHRHARALQAGLAAALAAGLGFVAVNPALGGPAGSQRPLSPFSSAAAAEQRDRLSAREATREDLAELAGQAVAQVAQVRAKAQSAQLPPEQLAALDALERQVDDLAGQVEPDRLAEARVSRAGGREQPGTSGAGEAGGAPGASGGAASGGAASGGAESGGAESGEAASGASESGEGQASDEGAASGADAGGGVEALEAGGPVAESVAPVASPGAGQPDEPAADPSVGVAAGTGAAVAADPGAAVAADPGAAQATAPAVPSAGLDITDAATLAAVLPTVAADEDPTASALRNSLLALVRTAHDVDAAADAAQAAAVAAEAAAAAARAQAEADAAAERQREEWADSLDGYPNGKIPASALCAPSFDSGALLRCDAAQALDRLDAAYAAVFGGHLQVTDSYRSYAAQVACRRAKGSLCASPGTSNHGWGVAVDLGGPAHSFGTDAHDWLLAHAREYGWDLPAWARATGSKPEPWHWEYVA